MAYYTREELMAQMPNVGDRMILTPHLHKSLGIEAAKPKPCVVVYINREHLWFEVSFGEGFNECYKLPLTRDVYKGGWANR